MRIVETASGYAIVTDGGDFIRKTDGEIFMTTDHAFAEAALAYLDQPGPAKRRGTHTLKSMFGV